jgi:transketolase
MTEDRIAQAVARCRRYRSRILEVSQRLTALHVAPAFSCQELIDCCYCELMQRDRDPKDTFIMSKGHGAMALYAVLEGLGIMSRAEMDSVCQPGSSIGGHPDHGLPGVEISSGSLGHGLPIAVGLARADLELGQERTIYVLMGDGEMMEGSVWESLMLAPSLGIKNIVVLVDHNKSIARGSIPLNHPNMLPLADKIAAFGWEVAEADGHSQAAIVQAISSRSRTRPFALVAHTVKGKGVSYMENKPIWAYRSPNPAEFAAAMQELTAPGDAA